MLYCVVRALGCLAPCPLPLACISARPPKWPHQVSIVQQCSHPPTVSPLPCSPSSPPCCARTSLNVVPTPTLRAATPPPSTLRQQNSPTSPGLPPSRLVSSRHTHAPNAHFTHQHLPHRHHLSYTCITSPPRVARAARPPAHICTSPHVMAYRTLYIARVVSSSLLVSSPVSLLGTRVSSCACVHVTCLLLLVSLPVYPLRVPHLLAQICNRRNVCALPLCPLSRFAFTTSHADDSCTMR